MRVKCLFHILWTFEVKIIQGGIIFKVKCCSKVVAYKDISSFDTTSYLRVFLILKFLDD